MNALEAYAWPGNVRELQNVIERAVVLSSGPRLSLRPEMLPAVESAPAVSREPQGATSAPAGTSGLSALLEDVEREQIVAALRDAGGVVEGPRGAAQRLKMHPNTLRSRIEKLGIRRPISQNS
jgi:formate hydrogenlyase transcriptional activator